MSQPRKSALVLTSLVLAILAALASGEVMARLYYRLAPQYGYRPDMPFTTDPDTGWIHKAGWQGHYIQPEFDTSLVFNDIGFRGARPYAVGTPDAPVVAVLGDSFVEGLQVAEPDLFTSVIERRLGGAVAQVQNYGISSLGPPHYLAVWRKYARPHHPAAVVIVVYTENDPINSSPELQGNTYGLRPNYRLDAQGQPVDLQPFVMDQGGASGAASAGAPAKPSWLDHFVLLTFVRGHWPQQQAEGLPADYLLLERQRDPAVERALGYFRWSLGTLIREVREAGAVPILVSIPPNYEVIPRLWTEVEQRYAASGRPSGLDRNRMADEMVADAKAFGVPLIRPAAAFKAALDAGEASYLEKDRHLSAVGHRLLGEMVAESLKPVLRTPH